MIALFFLLVTILAALLDRIFPHLMLLCGSLPLWIQIFVRFHPSAAILILFVLGILLDSLHFSLPFGFHAYFAILAFTLLKMVHNQLARTFRYYHAIELIVLCLTYYTAITYNFSTWHWPLLILSLTTSLFFNGLLLCAFLLLQKIRQKRAEKSLTGRDKAGNPIAK